MTKSGTRPAVAPAVLAAALMGAVALWADGAGAQIRLPAGTETDAPPRLTIPAPMGWETAVPPPAPRAEPDRRLDLQPRDQGLPDVADRLDRQQTEAELVKTTLLNRFGGLGFAELGSFHQEGSFYAAEVKTVDERWIWILIDPRTGEITPRP